MPVKQAWAKAPPTRKGTSASTSTRSARRRRRRFRAGLRPPGTVRARGRACASRPQLCVCSSLTPPSKPSPGARDLMQCQRPPTGGRCARPSAWRARIQRPSCSSPPPSCASPSSATSTSPRIPPAPCAPSSRRQREAADALLLCGDLTDYGTAEEAHVLADELAAVKVPIVAVLGNHDYESGTPEIVSDTLKHAGVRVLDGEACEIQGVGIAGAKGFAGGFGRGSLGAWGEPAIKLFVQGGLERGDEAGIGAGQAAHATAHRPAALLAHRRHGGRRAAGDLPLPGHAAGWRSRCCATRWTPSSTATRTAAHWRARPSTACPSTTWPSRCCSAAGRSSRRSCCSSCRARRE